MGTPLGPVDFLGSKLSINLPISSGTVGERKNEEYSGLIILYCPYHIFQDKCLKLPGTIGILLSMEGPILEK